VQNHGLDHVKALAAAVFEVAFAGGAVELLE
jgi:hypothetical protein